MNPRLAAIAIQGAVGAISIYYKVPESATSITEQLDKLTDTVLKLRPYQTFEVRLLNGEIFANTAKESCA